MSENGKELVIPATGRTDDSSRVSAADFDREQSGLAEWMSAIRREEVDRSTPDGLRQTIECALVELQAHSAILERTDFPPTINSVNALLMEIAESIEALHVMGEPVPMIDVTGISESFLMAMPEHPLLQRLERMLEQQRYKTYLISKWGIREERSRKILPSVRRLLQDM